MREFSRFHVLKNCLTIGFAFEKLLDKVSYVENCLTIATVTLMVKDMRETVREQCDCRDIANKPRITIS